MGCDEQFEELRTEDRWRERRIRWRNIAKVACQAAQRSDWKPMENLLYSIISDIEKDI